MTTPTTVARPFAHEAHAYDWLKAHNRPIIAAAVVAFVVVSVVRWYVNRVRGRRRDAEASWSRPVGRVLHDAVKAQKVTRRGGRIVYMRLRYGPDAILYGPAFANLEANLSEQLGIPITVKTDRERRLIHLRLDAPHKVKEQPAANPLEVRALKVAHKLLGPESQIVNFIPQVNGKVAELTITHASIDDAAADVRAKVDATMQAKLGQKLQPQWDMLNDNVTWRAVPDLPSRLMHPAIAAPDNHVIPFGVDANGKTVAWDLDSDVPHCMVAGPTGSGKSSTILTIAARASWFADIRVCDYKRLTARSLKDWPGITRMARDLDDIADLLMSTEREMMDRIVDLDTGKVDEDDLQPIIIIMEEGPVTIVKLEELHRRTGGEDGKPGKGPAPAKLSFDNLTLLGRQPRVHLCVAFQRPNADIIGGIIRDQFGCRVLLGKPKRGTREMMELDTAITTGPRGRGVADTGAGAREFQAWFTPDPARYDKLSADQRAIIDGLRPPSATFHVAPPAAPEPEPIAPLLPFVPRIVEAPAEAPKTRFCTACQQDHPTGDFGNSGSRCKASEAKRVAAARAKKRVPAGAEKGP